MKVAMTPSRILKRAVKLYPEKIAVVADAPLADIKKSVYSVIAYPCKFAFGK